MNKAEAPRPRILVVVGPGNKLVSHEFVNPEEYATPEMFYNAVIRARKKLRGKYRPSKYRVHEGAASSLADFSWAYPELLNGVTS